MTTAILLPLLAWNAAAVTVTGFSPITGQPGDLITINGSGFTGATSVGFNNFAPTLAGFMVQSDSQLTAVVPLGATTGPLSVNGAASSASFTVAPTIMSFTPATGASPTEVYIQGANFVTNNTYVTFSGTSPAITGTVTSSTEVAVAVPTGAATGPITVSTPAGSAVSTSNFVAGTMPTITSFSPAAGPVGTNVTIHGGNFFGTTTVKFGSATGASATASVVSTTELMVAVPTGATTGPLYVSTTYGTANSGANIFITGAGPIITDFYPTVGTLDTSVTLDGYNLTTATSATFNGTAESITGYSSTYLQVSISNPSGTGVIKVVTPQGTFTTTSNFSSGAGPVIGNYSPTIGGPGIYVVINGINFITGTTVKFNGVTATTHVTSSTQITATVPSGASTGPITATSSAGTSPSPGSNFVVTGTGPVITSFSPSNGVAGTVVTLNGENFTNISTVKFNGTAASFTTPTSTTVLYVTVPPSATSGLITVTGSGGGGNSPSLFYVQPWITGSTASGIVNSSLVITGLNLTNASSVVVGGVNYSAFTNSPTQIVAAVPSNAVTGLITITAPGGVFISTNNYMVLPKIYSFTPTIGPAGTVVTIGGTSLFDVTSVRFNGVAATPFNVQTNQLQVAVPAGATPGPLTVVTAGGNDVSTNIFTATFQSKLVLSKSVVPAIVGPGTNVTYTLMVTNEGLSTVTSVTITDNIPTGFNLTSSSSSVGTTVYTNNTVIATLGTLVTNTSASVTIKGTSTSLGSLTNTASLGVAEGNSTSGNSYAFAYVYFLSAVQRTLSITNWTNLGQVLVTWPPSTVPWTLQVNTNLLKTNGWLVPGNAPFVTNGLNAYTNILPSSNLEFFRLQGP